ncbi:MAG: hypothetical protein JJT89_11680 [Nitriliruptoraceae bacterium]|nr:hypothetical protein [Nitriliruptoraceae bacterium]
MSTPWSILRRLLAGGAIVALAVGFVAHQAGQGSDPILPPSANGVATDAAAPSVVVHRTATCGCCGGYEDILADAGYAVTSRIHDDLAPVRAELGVPESEASCHTMEVAGYVVEGHMPLTALEDLLLERPAVDGIALAGMPAGSPGMPGEQQAPFRVTALEGGAVTGTFGDY